MHGKHDGLNAQGLVTKQDTSVNTIKTINQWQHDTRD